MFEALCNHIKSAITIFPQRTDGKHDYRIWNHQLITYAGYQEPDGTTIGDPARVCEKLGWKPEKTPWDILPLVLQADGKDPEFFELPREIVMENVAQKMGLDTNSFVSLWKDKALVEVNIAVLHSYHRDTDSPWKTYQWTKSEGTKTVHRKFHFKQIARAVKFTSKLFGRALSKRIKATILYATETGKSEQYAKELGTIFGHAFNAQDFADHLFQMLYTESNNPGNLTSDLLSAGYHKTPTPKSLMRTNSVMRTNSLMMPSIEYKRQLTRLESNKSKASYGSAAGASSVEQIGPLSNVCYAVFALGSSAYPKFCNFGKTVDKVLGDLGGERILEISCGDEMFGQEQQFRSWSSNIFHVACETFCLEENDMVKDAKKALGGVPLTEETVRFGKPSVVLPLKTALEAGFRKQLITCKVKECKHLGDFTADRETIFVDMEPQTELKYDPGDHVGVMACNRREIVDAVLKRMKDVDDCKKPVQLQVMKDTLTPVGSVKTWERHERIPTITVREMFTRFLDITTPPSTKVLKYLAHACTNRKEAEQIRELTTDSNKYDDWRHFYFPHLGEILALFPSCRPQASLLAALLPPLQPRFYSISSSPLAHSNKIHVTVAVVVYKSQNGEGETHYGVCSNYLKNLKPDDELFVFIRRAPSFHMPKQMSAPLILIGPGSGIAPFRGFWHQRRHQIKNLVPEKQKLGPIWLFFGCRNRGMDLYKEEKEAALAEGVLTKTIVALSREPGVDKKHVQAILEEEGEEITRLLLEEDGHFYVCGDCKMAEEVQQKLKCIIKTHAKMTDQECEEFILDLMDENRYHEDIFGITLRTAEVQSASREFAKRTRLESAQSQP
ncbi:Nitric oxide synthase [Operophtera brumata]|uniref:nitric-oxide synthase (NADPH) n=1 Tax=Operophtera brumata TaxID=104452 RepID=A0A0L7L5X5_OPEBR|nr:Nitric oxide synthase [Operophtera brumata]